jgi:hypothetical protein
VNPLFARFGRAAASQKAALFFPLFSQPAQNKRLSRFPKPSATTHRRRRRQVQYVPALRLFGHSLDSVGVAIPARPAFLPGCPRRRRNIIIRALPAGRGAGWRAAAGLSRACPCHRGRWLLLGPRSPNGAGACLLARLRCRGPALRPGRTPRQRLLPCARPGAARRCVACHQERQVVGCRQRGGRHGRALTATAARGTVVPSCP